MKRSYAVAAMIGVWAAAPLAAQAICDSSNYGLTGTADNDGQISSNTACTSTAAALFDLFSGVSLSSLLPTYTDFAMANLDVNFASLPMQLSFLDTGTTLTFNVPDLGITNLQFTGSTRDASIDLLKDYLKKTNLAGDVMRYQASHSPTSPITGINGLIPMTVAQNFDNAFSAPYQDATGEGSDSNLTGVGVTLGSGTAAGKNTSVASLPFSHIWRSKARPGEFVILGTSLTQVNTEGAKAYHAGVGVSARVPMSENWALLPALGYAVTGSADLNTAAGVYSASIGSTYRVGLGLFDLMIGNMAGYYRTSRISVGDYSFDPKIKTLAIRNGVMLSRPIELMGMPMAAEYYIVDTRYTTGTDFFINNTQEYGVSIGTNRRGDVRTGYFRLGLRYTRGKASDALSLQGGYWF